MMEGKTTPTTELKVRYLPVYIPPQAETTQLIPFSELSEEDKGSPLPSLPRFSPSKPEVDPKQNP